MRTISTCGLEGEGVWEFGEGFFRLWGNKAILLGIWIDLTLAILLISFFLCNKRLYPEIIIFVYILIRREGVIWI